MSPFASSSAASIALNRVAGQEPTSIYGSLSANGQVFLINPSGILFGSSSRVDVGALTASTLAMSEKKAHPKALKPNGTNPDTAETETPEEPTARKASLRP